MSTSEQPAPLYGEDYYRDPYPLFSSLREQGTVHPVAFPAIDAWLVTGYDAAHAALGDDRLGKNHARANARWHAKASIMPEPQHSRLQVHLLHQDPPRHTAMRAMIADHFTARRSEAHRAGIRAHVHALIDDLPVGSVDFIEGFAGRLPFLALRDAIGLPDNLAQQFDPAWGGVVAPVGPDDPRRPHYEGLLRGLEGYIADVVAHFTGGSGDQSVLLARLVREHEHGDLTSNELSSIIFQLLAAGQDPVTNQLGMAILTLLRHPDAHAWLVAHPDGIDRATEELLRYESAFGQTTWRFFTEDTEFGDHTVPAGDSVIISLMAANRDPAKFRCPAELNLQRTPNPHLAFGHGVHFCPGAHLARIQIQETLTAITARITDLRLDCEETDLEFLHAPLARGVTKLPIRYSAVKPA
ncbi:cytochrome P450 [Gordonia sp. VNK1]|uniref:cytochrome P450 n=1 Tax=Gordonia oleivorans TaxID=3156618 RepID=UPI0032B51C82